jgi:hypothetical protein
MNNLVMEIAQGSTSAKAKQQILISTPECVVEIDGDPFQLKQAP